MNLETSIVQPNEVVKAEDWTFGLDAQVTNIGVALSALMENKNNFIVGGEVTPFGGMNVSIAPIFGFCKDTMQCFLDTEKIEPVAIASSTGKSRVDIIEVKGEYEEFDEQQRKFMDFETSLETYQFVNTKKRFKVKINVKKGDDNNQTAPSVTDGWVKIAEIRISESTVEITEDDIFNVTTDISGTENTLWTNDKDSTYNVGYLTDVNARFRQAHNSDGSHKGKVIKPDNIDIGSNNKQLNASLIPIAKDIAVSNENISVSDSVTNAIYLIAEKLSNVYEKYMDRGEYKFNGEISASDVTDEQNNLVDAVKIKADGEGNATISVGGKQLLTFTKSGSIKAYNGYKASADADLVTKTTTNEINSQIQAVNTRLDTIENEIDFESYSNSVLSRFEISETLYAATTQNITLAGLKTNLDGVSVSVGSKILVKNQDNPSENGIYIVAEQAWTRGSYVTDASLKHKLFVIANGTANKGHLYYTPLEEFEVNTDDIIFEDAIYSIATRPYTVALRDANSRLIGNLTGKADNATLSDKATISLAPINGMVKLEIYNASTPYIKLASFSDSATAYNSVSLVFLFTTQGTFSKAPIYLVQVDARWSKTALAYLTFSCLYASKKQTTIPLKLVYKYTAGTKLEMELYADASVQGTSYQSWRIIPICNSVGDFGAGSLSTQKWTFENGLITPVASVTANLGTEKVISYDATDTEIYANATSATTATTATKLGTTTVGSSKKPIYLNNGVPTATSGVVTGSVSGTTLTLTIN